MENESVNPDKPTHRIEKDGNIVNIFINFGSATNTGGSGKPDNAAAGGSEGEKPPTETEGKPDNVAAGGSGDATA